MCQSCKRTFNALTNTPLAGLRKKDLWLPYMQAMLDSKVLRKIRETIDINLKTAFSWRHKFSKLLYKDRPEILSGIVEADETYFRTSFKGNKMLDKPSHKRGAHKAAKRGLSKDQVCVLVATDRGNHFLEFITGLGAVNGNWLDNYFINHISTDSILITDGLKSYVHFCNVNHITHKVVKNHRT
jgi:transposase-like protein